MEPPVVAASPLLPRLRNLLRAIHRDLGFFLVGLTFIYAGSGLALNHIVEWDPNFTQYEHWYQLDTPLPDDDKLAALAVLSQLGIPGDNYSVYGSRESVSGVEIELPDRLIRLNIPAAEALTEFKDGRPRQSKKFGPLPRDDFEAGQAVMKYLEIPETQRAKAKIYRATYTQREIEIAFKAQRTLRVDASRGIVHEEGQTPRFLLRVANWLHVERGKVAPWLFIGDGYALGLMFLALSGMLMVPGRKGLLGRGGLWLIVGLAVPLVYVWYSGGPTGG